MMGKEDRDPVSDRDKLRDRKTYLHTEDRQINDPVLSTCYVARMGNVFTLQFTIFFSKLNRHFSHFYTKNEV